MTNFFAASTAHVLFYLILFILWIFCLIIVFILLAFVLAKLAPRHVSAWLTAAPPHLTTIITLMSPTAPVKVFFFIVLSATVFALFKAAVELTLPLYKLLYP